MKALYEMKNKKLQLMIGLFFSAVLSTIGYVLCAFCFLKPESYAYPLYKYVLEMFVSSIIATFIIVKTKKGFKLKQDTIEKFSKEHPVFYGISLFVIFTLMISFLILSTYKDAFNLPCCIAYVVLSILTAARFIAIGVKCICNAIDRTPKLG